jgi:hypothetical protein
VEAVTARDGVAADLVPFASGVGVAEHGVIAVQAGHFGRRDLELHRGAGRQPRPDQVLDDLGLRVDRDPPATSQVTEVQMVPLPRELQVDAAVLKAFGVHPLAEAHLAEQFHRAGFEQPCPLPRLAVGSTAVLHHHRVNTAQREQVGQQQASRTSADYAYLGTFHDRHNVSG